MKRLILLAALLLALALGGEAAADHLTGRYTMVLQDPRTQSMAGSVLQIRQSGRTLQGQISGARFNAQVQGETDGGDNARGMIQTQDGQRQYFEAVHGQAGLRMTLIASDNRGQPDRSASLNIQRQGAMDRARIWREAQQEISRIYSPGMAAAATRAERPCPALAAIGLIPDVIFFQEFQLDKPVDSVSHRSKLMRVRAGKAMAQRHITIG